MTAERFGSVPGGEYAAVSAARQSAPSRVEGGVADAAVTRVAAGAAGVRDQAGVPDAAVTPRVAGAEGSAGGRNPARTRRQAGWWRPIPPPQHGAWAFLIVPVLLGFTVAGVSGAGWLFLVSWVCAYPVGYYAGRALTARARRGAWSRLARRELGRALPWAVLLALAGLPLVLTRPWLLVAGLALALLWAVGLGVAAKRGERSMSNDLLLVAQAVAAVPLAVAVVAGPAAMLGDLLAATVTVTVLCAVYLAGSVIHVKSLLREADDRRWHAWDVAWHAGALVGAGLVDTWWIVGFGPALLRAIIMRPGLRPGVIGAVEAVVALLVVVAAILAV